MLSLKNYLGLALALGLSAQTVFAETPILERRILVSHPDTDDTMSVFGSYSEHPGELKVFFYRPHKVRLDRNDEGEAKFNFNLTDFGSTLAFSMKLDEPAILKNNREYVKQFLSDRIGVTPEKIIIAPLNFETAKTAIFFQRGVKQSILPPDGIDATGELPFYFSYDRIGTHNFQKNIIESGQTLGTFQTTVIFRTGEDYKERVMRFPIRLDEVPLCAVSYSGCGFDY